jgi:hypothetical protein
VQGLVREPYHRNSALWVELEKTALVVLVAGRSPEEVVHSILAADLAHALEDLWTEMVGPFLHLEVVPS